MGIGIDTVRAGELEMKYFRFGRGERTLVILPGLSVRSVMGAADAVAAAYARFAEEFTVYVFDRRGDPPPVYTVRDMARDTAEVFRALGLERVCLFGASQGGMIALALAAAHPELVSRLAIGSSAIRVGEERMRAIGEWIALAERGDREGLYLSFGERLYPPAIFEASRELLLAEAETVTDAELERFVIFAEGTRGLDLTDAPGRIACPVLVLGASDDAVLGPDAAGELGRAFGERADFELFVYDGFGHAAYDTAPDYGERLFAFFSK